MDRPNIIIFNPDQMRADSLHHLGNRAARTDFLDEFAANDAVSFRRAFCQNPVCVPSRCSFSTGLYPHVRGHRTMSYLLRRGEPTFFSELKKAGYYVWMNGRNDLLAGQDGELFRENADEIYCGGKTSQLGPEADLRGALGDKNYYSFYAGRFSVDENGKNNCPDEEDLEAAIERIRKPPADRPLCLFLGLLYPHPPYGVEEPYFSAIDAALLPPRIAGSGIGKPRMESLIRERQNLFGYGEEDWDALRACYLGMCMKVDAMFRKLCDALKEAGLYDNSLILFFSDHGDYTGDYGLTEKAQNTFEDCLVNVPLLIKPPQGKADRGICGSLVELVDVYATIMDFAKVQPSHSHFGKSLRPLLYDRSANIRDHVCCEGGRLAEEIHCDEFHSFGAEGIGRESPYWPRLSAQADGTAHGKGVMLRTKKYKYVSRLYESDELYDLEKDPHELRNLISDKRYSRVAAQLREKTLRWLLATSDTVPYDFDSRVGYEILWGKVKDLVPEGHEEEIRALIGTGISLGELKAECRKRFTESERKV